MTPVGLWAHIGVLLGRLEQSTLPDRFTLALPTFPRQYQLSSRLR